MDLTPEEERELGLPLTSSPMERLRKLEARCARLEALCKIRGDALDAVKIWDDSRAPASIKAEQWPMIVAIIDRAMKEKP